MPDVIKFPLPTKHKKEKKSYTSLSIGEIQYTIEYAHSQYNNLYLAPLILSYSYTGVYAMKEAEDSFLVKIEDGGDAVVVTVKKSNLQGIN